MLSPPTHSGTKTWSNNVKEEGVGTSIFMYDDVLHLERIFSYEMTPSHVPLKTKYWTVPFSNQTQPKVSMVPWGWTTNPIA